MGGSKERTYVGLQVQPLMDEPDQWYKASMLEAYKAIPHGMKTVMKQYVNGMLDARSMFNDTFLTNLGYNPRESIKYRVVDHDLVLSWAKTNISSSVVSVSEYKFSIPTMEELALEYLQDTYTDMNLDEKSFKINGTKWYLSGVTVVSTMGSDATCYKDSSATVGAYAIANGTTVVSIDETIVEIKGINYWSAVLGIGSVKVPVEYKTIACPGINTAIQSTIIAEYDNRVYPTTWSDDEGEVYSSDVVISVKLDVSGQLVVSGRAKNVEYSRWTAYGYTMITKETIESKVGEIRSDIANRMGGLVERLVFKYVLNGKTKLMVAEVSEDLVSGVENAKAFPIIPLRENHAFVNESTSMKVILNKLGMNTKDFRETLDDSRIKNAAVVFVVNIDDTSTAGTKYIFETLVNMVTTTTAGPKNTTETGYHLDYGFSDIDMKTRLEFSLRFVEGVIADVGKYSRSSITESYSQRNSETNTMETVTVTYQLIRKQINSLYYQELKVLSGKTEWSVGGYEKLKDGAVYIPVVDIGLNTLLYEDLCYVLALSTNLLTTSITVVKSKWWQSGFVKFLLMIPLMWLAATGNPIPLLLFMATESGFMSPKLSAAISILSMFTGNFTGIASAPATTGEVALTTAQALLTVAQLAVSINAEGLVKSIANQRAAKQAELDASEKQMEEMYSTIQNSSVWLGISDRDPEMMYAMSNTQLMCNYDLLYDYDGLIDNKIKSVGI